MINKTINIVFIIPKLIFGGIEHQVLLLITELKKEGYNPILIAVNDQTNIEFTNFLNEIKVKWEIVNWWNFNMRIYPKFFFKSLYICFKLRKYNPDIILSYTRDISFWVNLFWQITGASKSYFMERGSIQNYMGRKNSIWTKLSMINSTKVVFNSNHAKDDILPFLGIKEKKGIVIKNGLNTSFVINCLNDATVSNMTFLKNFANNYILMVANFFPCKNHDLLINHWKNWKGDEDKTWLVFIGDTFNKYKVGHIDYENRIIFMGQRIDKDFWIKNSLFCILSTNSEGCPNVLLEYIFLNKLVICSNVRGCKEIIPEEFHNFLLFENDPHDFHLKLKFAFENFNNKQIIDKCHLKVDQNYSLKKMVKSYQVLFDE